MMTNLNIGNFICDSLSLTSTFTSAHRCGNCEEQVNCYECEEALEAHLLRADAEAYWLEHDMEEVLNRDGWELNIDEDIELHNLEDILVSEDYVTVEADELDWSDLLPAVTIH